MEETVMICNNEVQVKKWDGKRVVTFADIDRVHSRSSGTASRNFRKNREHFIETTDFYRIKQPDEIRRLDIFRPQGGIPNEIIVVTESGYLMLVK